MSSKKKERGYKTIHKEIDGVEYKTCCRCNEWKTLIEYRKNKNNSDGYECACKECRLKDYQKNKKARQEQGKEAFREKQKKRYENKKIKMEEDLKDHTYKELPFDEKYLCTENGSIYSTKLYRWLKQRKNKQGYMCIQVGNKGYLVHRLVAMTFIDNPEDHPVVNHIDSCKHNNHYTNLEWTTQKGNVNHHMDKVKSGKLTKSPPSKYNICKDVDLSEFKKINLEGFDKYMINHQGDVYSTHRKMYIKHIENNGYIYVGLSQNKKTRSISVHRLVALTFIDNPKNKKFVNHIDGDKSNNSLSNLEWVTRSENQIHAIETGLIKVKTKKINVFKKETNELVKTFNSINEVAKHYKTHRNCVSDVCRGIRNVWNGLLFQYAI